MKKRRSNCKACEFGCSKKTELLEHYRSVHGASSEQELYVKTFLDGVEPTCECGCGIKTQYNTWSTGFVRFLRGHNGNIYKIYDEEKAKEISEKRALALRGQVGWSRGLTKETSVVLARAAETRSRTVKRQFESGEREPWLKGKTKDTDERVKSFAETIKAGFASGKYRPWALGLSKETDPRLAEMSRNHSVLFSETGLRRRLDSLKRLNCHEIMRRLSDGASNLKLLSSLDMFIDNQTENLEFECLACGNRGMYSLRLALTNRCFACDPVGSAPQVEVSKFINSLGLNTELCNRNIINPYEVDITVDGTNLCVEFNGLYFHSEHFKHYEYHGMKTKLCRDNGCTLFHIFSDEWENKKDIVKSMLAHKLMKSQRKIYARSCTIKQLTPKEKRMFFEDNHIDGDAQSSLAFGLVYEDELVAAISLRRPFHKKWNEYMEVCRFSTAKWTSVVGGLSRLSKFALKISHEKGLRGLLSYVDTRYGSGDGYANSGYRKIDSTGNRFWWTDGRVRLDRFKVRANKKEGLTEREASLKLGVVKVWGCPNDVYIYE